MGSDLTILTVRRARRHREHGAAALARPEMLARVEALDRRFQLHLDVLAREAHLVQLGLAALAEPGEAVDLIGTSLALDHQSPRPGRAHGAVRRSRPAEHDLALAHASLASLAGRIDELDDDVAAQLTEDLVSGVDVKIVARIRAADDL